MNHPTPPTTPELVLIVNSGPCVEPSAPKPDAYVQFLLDECVNRIPDLPLRQFLGTVFSEVEVARTLGAQVIQDGRPAGLRIRHLFEIAGDVLRQAELGADEFEAVYACTFLHGIAYFLSPYGGELGNHTERQACSKNVSNALRHLEATNPGMARLVRLCMGWSNCDEEEAVFTQWLEQRMQRAIGTLELVKF